MAYMLKVTGLTNRSLTASPQAAKCANGKKVKEIIIEE